MSRKTWRDLARQQAGGGSASPPAASLGQLSAQVPGLQRLLQQRETLEQQMRALGGQPQEGSASRVYPVASSADRRAEQADWERRRAQQHSAPATDSTPLQQWWQARDGQVAQAKDAAARQQLGQLNLTQRLDQRVAQARSNALSRLQQERSEALREPLLRPLTDRLNTAFDSTAASPPALREPTSLPSFDDRYAQRQRRLLGVETGPLEQLAQRREQAQERRLEQRREARRAERQQDLLQQRAAERRSQRPQLSTD
ncbi:hypothetical protein [Halopseudomonas sabulinigri]|uniref:Uncharacterized protein n=1 Tax=Halopseudomonas sabulinigri TaxID=472181 RepID=A0ABP9ZSE8_9GAMM